MNKGWSENRRHYWSGVWDELDDIESSGDVLAGIEHQMNSRYWDIKAPVSLFRRQPNGLEYWVDCFLS